ncbi:MAG: hypothetical protein AABY33_03300 [Pseudomonadota bacterium]
MIAKEKTGSNIAKYNSLPDGHKVLIEFIVSRTLVNNPPADLSGVKYDPKNPSDYLKSVLANRSPAQLLERALDEEKQYTEGRKNKLNEYEKEYHEAFKELRLCNNLRLDTLERFVDKHELELEELKKWNKLKPAEKINKITRAIEEKYKYKGIPTERYDGILKDLEGSKSQLDFIRKMNIKLEELKEWDKLKPNEKYEKVGSAIDNKYIDKYIDIKFYGRDRENAAGIKPSDKRDREAVKAELIRENNISGIKSRALMSIDTDHYSIVSQLNDAFHPQRENQPGYRSR